MADWVGGSNPLTLRKLKGFMLANELTLALSRSSLNKRGANLSGSCSVDGQSLEDVLAIAYSFFDGSGTASEIQSISDLLEDFTDLVCGSSAAGNGNAEVLKEASSTSSSSIISAGGLAGVAVAALLCVCVAAVIGVIAYQRRRQAGASFLSDLESSYQGPSQDIVLENRRFVSEAI
jgi:hypothetical protein